MKNIHYLIPVFFFLFYGNMPSFGQEDSLNRSIDSIIVKAGDYVFINDSLTFIEKDTIFYPKQGYEIRYLGKDPKKADEFYKILKQKAEEKKITSGLYDLFVKDYGTRSPKKDKISTDEFKQYEGKKISSIHVQRLDVFGPSFRDTTRRASTWLSSKANNIHIKTLPSILKNNLLIQKGDHIDPFIIADNERIIRNLSYIKDAKFIIQPHPTDTNYVDILVVTQDVWSIGLEGNLTAIDAGFIEIFDKNIFGTGHQQGNLLEYDAGTFPTYGYEGYYSVSNISGSFINASVFYQHNKNRERYGISVNRRFFTPDIKYGGGIQLYKELWYEGYINDTNLNLTPQNHIIEDIWIGRSIKLAEDIDRSFRKNLFITSRLINDSYQYKEVDVFDSTLQYIDNTQFYLSFGISKTKYYEGFLISSFGKTEDIPVGYLFDVKTGYQFDETGPRLYLGASFSISDFKAKFGYIQTGFTAGTFFNNETYEQALIQFKINYFTKIFKIFDYQSRQFLKIDFLTGFNRRPYERVNINNRNGIRQFRINDLYGDKKFTVTLENVLFTPINYYGFRFAVFTFIDIGVVGNDMDFIIQNKYYSGLGFGLRIRNENLIFKTLEFKFLFYPVQPDNHNNTWLHVANERGFDFQNYEIKAPSVTPFQ